jgi:hypothetical protein
VADIWDDDDDPDQKNRKLRPNAAALGNGVTPADHTNPDTEFKAPGFLHMTDP